MNANIKLGLLLFFVSINSLTAQTTSDLLFEYANAKIVNTTGYDGNPTNALYIEFIMDDTNFVSYSRVQYVMNGDSLSNDPVQRMNQRYVKYKIKTHLDHTDTLSDWRLLIV